MTSAVEDGAVGDETTRRGSKVFDLCRGLLYWQGFHQDEDEMAEPDLEFYLKYFSSRLAHLLAANRPLRVALKIFRRINPWFLLFTLTVRVTLLLPMGMFLYRTDTLECVANFYGVIMEGSQLMAIATAYFKPKLLKTIFTEMDVMITNKHIDNEEQRKTYEKTRSFCRGVITRFLIPFIAVISIAVTLDFCFHLLPQRRFIFREYYPWNTITSPGFEITLFVRWLHIISPTMIVFTLVSAIAISMILPRSNFQILNNKLENIRPIAINRIKARKLEGTNPLAEETVVDIEFEHSQQARVPGPALGDDQLRAGPAVGLDARRIDDYVTFLNPLFEARGLGPRSTSNEVTLEGAIQGRWLRDGTTAENAMPVDHLALASPLHGPEMFGTTSARDERPLEAVFHGRWNRDGIVAPNARQIDDLALRSAANDVYNLGSNPGRDEVTLEDIFKDGFRQLEELEGIATATELDKEMRDCLVENIQLHMKLIRYVDLCNSFLNVCLMGLLVVNTVTFGVTAIILTKPHESNGFLMLSLLIYTLELAIIYLIFNNAMQRVSDQHEDVCVSMYNSDWTGASPSFKKSMLIIMSRANVPLEMKPTGMDPLSRRNFAQVMNLAYKVLSSLPTMT